MRAGLGGWLVFSVAVVAWSGAAAQDRAAAGSAVPARPGLPGEAQQLAQGVQSPASGPGGPSGEEPAAASDLWTRDTLTGSWGGLRSSLADTGLKFGANYIGETFGNLRGGLGQGAIYEGRLALTADLDLEKLFGWNGAIAHATAYQIHGRGLSANYVGNLMTVSNIEALPSTRLFTLWLQQALFDDKVSLRAGQLAADDEFIVSPTASTFINGTFGWPVLMAADLPSGGPAYPLATHGVRLRIDPADNLSIQAAVFSGNPAGIPGTENPQRANANGTTFSFSGGVFLITEAAYSINQSKTGAPGRTAAGLPGTYKLGGWYHSGTFADQNVDANGLSLADPASSGIPRSYSENYGVYVVADQVVWRVPDTEDQGLSLFLRLGGSPADRNLIAFYGDGGAGYKGLVPGRDQDILAIAFAYAGISGDAAGLDRDVRIFTGTNRPVRNYEAILELTYLAQLAPWWTLQPDLQFVFHPGGNIPNPRAPTNLSPMANAVVLGLRSMVTF